MVEITTLYWLKISTMMLILFANVMKVGCDTHVSKKRLPWQNVLLSPTSWLRVCNDVLLEGIRSGCVSFLVSKSWLSQTNGSYTVHIHIYIYIYRYPKTRQGRLNCNRIISIIFHHCPLRMIPFQEATGPQIQNSSNPKLEWHPTLNWNGIQP